MLGQRLANALLDAVQALDLDIGATWIEEIRHRISDIGDYAAAGVSAAEVFAEVRRWLG